PQRNMSTSLTPVGCGTCEKPPFHPSLTTDEQAGRRERRRRDHAGSDDRLSNHLDKGFKSTEMRAAKSQGARERGRGQCLMTQNVSASLNGTRLSVAITRSGQAGSAL